MPVKHVPQRQENCSVLCEMSKKTDESCVEHGAITLTIQTGLIPGCSSLGC